MPPTTERGFDVDRLVAQPPAKGRRAGPAPLRAADRRRSVVFPLCLLLDARGLWLPALGVGVALLSWTSWWLLPLLAAEAIVIGMRLRPGPLALADALLLSGQIGLSWWAYYRLGRGSRWLEDPHSCMLFLVLVPGLIAAVFALVQALLGQALGEQTPLWTMFGTLWLSQILGLLVPMPLLLVLVTPWLARSRRIDIAAPLALQGNPWHRWSTGELIEMAGLTLSATVLALVLAGLQVQPAQPGLPPWSLWGVGLLIVVWSALRQGLARRHRGREHGSARRAAGAGGNGPDRGGPACKAICSPKCSTALLVGVSAGWIQASEARYRHIFSEVPLVLYSARLPRPYRSPRRPASARQPARMRPARP